MNQWMMFVAAMVMLIALLYIPGYIFCRGMRFSRLVSTICAPVISAACFAVPPILFSKAGITCSGPLLLSFALIVCLIVYGVSRVTLVRSALMDADNASARVGTRHEASVLDVTNRATVSIGTLTVPFEWLVLAAYVVFGMLVSWYMLISNLGTADAFYCRWDNLTHINALRAFLDTGVWSSLEVDPYAASTANQNPFTDTVWFYPAAWHDTVATASSLSGISPLIVANALDALLVGFVYPSSTFLLMKVLFPDAHRIIAAGSIICPSYAAFPWAYFLFGPYVANLYGQAMLPSVLAVFILYLTSRFVRKKPVSFVLFGVVSFVGLALGHPNTIFTALLYLGAFMCSFVYHAVGESGITLFGSKRAAQVAALISVLAIVVAIWAYCFNLPVLHDVVFFKRGVNSSVKHALWTIANLALTIAKRPMYALAFLTIVGGIVCLRQKMWWFLMPAIVMALAYLATRTSESMLKNYLGGFWYVDVRRLTANLCMFLVPVTSVGADVCVRWVTSLIERLSRSWDLRGEPISKRGEYAIIVVLGALFIYVNFAPWIPMPFRDGKADTGIGTIRVQLHSVFSPDEEQIFSHVEREFVERAAEIVPKGELVLNMPHDGSGFAYGTNGLNVYYRACRSRGMTDDGELIRSQLVHYVDDQQVREAVERTGAKYLLQLDQGGTVEDRPWLVQYVNERYNTGPEYWEGINAIRDDTPGFTVVLSEGDMRLFRIDPLE